MYSSVPFGRVAALTTSQRIKHAPGWKRTVRKATLPMSPSVVRMEGSLLGRSVVDVIVGVTGIATGKRVAVPTSIHRTVNVQRKSGILFIHVSSKSVSLHGSDLRTLRRTRRSFSRTTTRTNLHGRSSLTSLVGRMHTRQTRRI